MRRALLVTTALLAFAGAASAAQVQQNLAGSKLLIDDVIGDVTIIVAPGVQGIQITADGDERFTSRLSFSQNGERAEIRMGSFSSDSDEGLQRLRLTVTVPPGTDTAINNLIGDAVIGDLKAPVSIDAIAGEIRVGSVTSASLGSNGSAEIEVTEATGALSIDTSGSGEVKVGRAGATSISISGSGDVEVGDVNGSLGIDVSGSANVTIGNVNGATAVSISGGSEVYIGGGRADPFAADTSGSGSIVFVGTAVNPQISTSGSGDICLAATEGSVQSDGGLTVSATACKRS